MDVVAARGVGVGDGAPTPDAPAARHRAKLVLWDIDGTLATSRHADGVPVRRQLLSTTTNPPPQSAALVS